MALLNPVPNGRITQRYGIPVAGVASLEPAMWASGDKSYWVWFPGSTFYSSYHPGVDHGAVTGTAIHAIEAGTVVFSGWRGSISGYAVEVEIRPGVRYGMNHCSALRVSVGAHVNRDQIIALVGSTGTTTGPHTHAFISIKEAGSDRILRTFIYNPALFEAGGKFQNDPRVKPLGTAPPPPPQPLPDTSGYPRTVYFAAGTYTGYKFANSGTIVASKPYTLAQASMARASQRSAIVAQGGYWYYITDGIWADFWIKDGPGVSTGAPPPSQNTGETKTMPGFKIGSNIGTFKFVGVHALISPTDPKVHYLQAANAGPWDVAAILDLKTPSGVPVDIDGNSPPRNSRDQVYLVDAPTFGVAAYALRQDGLFTPK